jgi:hypothetical protein
VAGASVFKPWKVNFEMAWHSNGIALRVANE